MIIIGIETKHDYLACHDNVRLVRTRSMQFVKTVKTRREHDANGNLRYMWITEINGFILKQELGSEILLLGGERFEEAMQRNAVYVLDAKEGGRPVRATSPVFDGPHLV